MGEVKDRAACGCRYDSKFDADGLDHGIDDSQCRMSGQLPQLPFMEHIAESANTALTEISAELLHGGASIREIHGSLARYYAGRAELCRREDMAPGAATYWSHRAEQHRKASEP